MRNQIPFRHIAAAASLLWALLSAPTVWAAFPSVVPDITNGESAAESDSPTATPTATATASATATPTATPTATATPTDAPDTAFVFDGQLRVRVLGPDFLPVADANVTLAAFLAEGAAFAAHGVTDDTGIAALTGLPIPTGEAPLIWVVNASGRSTVAEGNCVTTLVLRGSQDVVAARRDPEGTVEVFTDAVSSTEACESSTPTDRGGRSNEEPGSVGQPTGPSGGGTGGLAPGAARLTPPATSMDELRPAAAASMAPLLTGLLVLAAAVLRLLPRRR